MDKTEKDKNQSIVDEFGLPIQKAGLTGRAIPSLDEQQDLHNMLKANKPKIVKELKAKIVAINGGNTGPKVVE